LPRAGSQRRSRCFQRIAIAGIQVGKADVARQIGNLDLRDHLRREALRRLIRQMDDFRRNAGGLRRSLQLFAELRHEPLGQQDTGHCLMLPAKMVFKDPVLTSRA
jgi:hypothetical protein